MAELHRVTGQGNRDRRDPDDRQADARPDRGGRAHSPQEGGHERRQPGPRRQRLREDGERDHREREGAAGRGRSRTRRPRVYRGVVERLAREPRGPRPERYAWKLIAERIAGGAARISRQRGDVPAAGERDQRRGEAAGARGPVAPDVRSSSRAAPRHAPVQEWRPEEVPAHAQAQAQPRVHPRSVLVRPADRHDRDPVVTTPGEVDQLHVEDDARDLLPREQVLRRLAGEALEPALRVLDVADGPDRGESVECATERSRKPGCVRLMSLPSGWIRLPSAMSWSRRASTRSGSWSGGVARSASAKTARSVSAASMPAFTAAPFPPCGTARRARKGIRRR